MIRCTGDREDWARHCFCIGQSFIANFLFPVAVWVTVAVFGRERRFAFFIFSEDPQHSGERLGAAISHLPNGLPRSA